MQFPPIYKQQSTSIPAYSAPILDALIQNLYNYRYGYRRSALLFALENLDGDALQQFYAWAMYVRPMLDQDERDLLARIALKLAAGPLDPRASFDQSPYAYAEPGQPALAGNYGAAPSFACQSCKAPLVRGAMCSCSGTCEPCRVGDVRGTLAPWPVYAPPSPSMPGMTADYMQQMDAPNYRPGAGGGPYFPGLGRAPYQQGTPLRPAPSYAPPYAPQGFPFVGSGEMDFGADYGGESGAGYGSDPWGGGYYGDGGSGGMSEASYNPADYGGAEYASEAQMLSELGMSSQDKQSYGITSEDLKALHEIEKTGASSPPSAWPQGQKPATQPKSPVPPAAAAGSNWQTALATAIGQAASNIPTWVNQANQTALQREIFSFCATNPAHPYCNRTALPPSVQQCQMAPAFPGCAKLLASQGLPLPPGTKLPVYPWQTPTPAQCAALPTLPNCPRSSGSDMTGLLLLGAAVAIGLVAGGKK